MFGRLKVPTVLYLIGSCGCLLAPFCGFGESLDPIARYIIAVVFIPKLYMARYLPQLASNYLWRQIASSDFEHILIITSNTLPMMKLFFVVIVVATVVLAMAGS